MDWEGVLTQVIVPDGGATFYHIVCSQSALWAAKIILVRLDNINQAARTENAGEKRLLVYALPDQASVDVASAFLREQSELDVGDTVLIMTYADMHDALGAIPLPAFLRYAIVVLDTDFGRISATLVDLASRLFATWSQLKKNGEAFRCAAVSVSPHEWPIWADLSMTQAFSMPLVTCALEGCPKIDYIPPEDGNDLVHMAVDTILSRATPSERATILCFASPGEALMIQRALAQRSHRADPDAPAVICLTVLHSNVATQWAAMSQIRGPALVVLLVDPSLRFLPVIEHRCEYILLSPRLKLGVNGRVHQAATLPTPVSRHDVDLAVGMACGTRAPAYSVSVVGNALIELDEWEESPGSAEWLSWPNFPATLVSLIDQLDGSTLSTLGDLPTNIKTVYTSPWFVETLRRLLMAQLIERKPPLMPGGVQTMRFQRLGSLPRARQAVSFLRAGLAATLPEALTLVEIAAASTPAVKQTDGGLVVVVKIVQKIDVSY
ncbi:hypothetical protein L209DRAFT_780664 [Thermothelomyces heterothallicus CBS 203.75]